MRCPHFSFPSSFYASRPARPDAKAPELPPAKVCVSPYHPLQESCYYNVTVFPCRVQQQTLLRTVRVRLPERLYNTVYGPGAPLPLPQVLTQQCFDTTNAVMKPLSRSSAGTLYHQLLGILRGRIESGEIGVGDRLPSEADLVSDFGVSRTTARRALDELRREGLVRREPGRGTFLASPRLRSNTGVLAQLHGGDRTLGLHAGGQAGIAGGAARRTRRSRRGWRSGWGTRCCS